MAENKVHFGLKNLHYSVVTISTSGTATYATPVAVPGAVSLEISRNETTNKFYADDIPYYITYSSEGLSGTLEIANITEKMMTEIWGYTQNTDNVLQDNADAEPKTVALLFEFDGDEQAKRYAFYRCVLQDPGVSSSTKTSSTDPVTASISFEATADESGHARGETCASTSTTVYANWYSQVYA